MLTREQMELIQQEIDGANSPMASAALRSLLDQNPEARALAAELRRVAALFAQVSERVPSPHLKHAILDGLPQPARASPGGILRRAGQQLRFITEQLERAIMTKRAMLIGSAAVAVLIVGAGLIT